MSQIKLCAVCIVDTMSTLVSLCITSCIIDVCVCTNEKRRTSNTTCKREQIRRDATYDL